MAKLFYQGHGSFRIVSNAGTVCYVDPYIGEGYDLSGDLILISHEHHDHNHTDLITLKADGVILRAKDLLQHGVYGHATVKDLMIEAVPAYNSNHPKDACVGFFITVDGITLYAAGDTSKTDAMDDFAERHLDYAVLPCDGIYNMDIPEASECAKIIGAKHSIPIHIKPGVLFDRKRAEQFTAEGRILLEPSDEIIL